MTGAEEFDGKGLLPQFLDLFQYRILGPSPQFCSVLLSSLSRVKLSELAGIAPGPSGI